MDEKRIASVTLSNIGDFSMKLVIEFDDNTFVTDYPVRTSEGTMYEYPERIPNEIRASVDFAFQHNRDHDAILEANEHGHPNWSHRYAYGPCTKPSASA